MTSSDLTEEVKELLQNVPKIRTSADLYKYADKLGLNYKNAKGKPFGTEVIKGMIAEMLWANEHPGEEMPPQIAPMLLRDITAEGKDYVDKTFKKEEYVLQQKLNGQRLILVIEPSGKTHMTSRDRSAKTFRFSELDDHVLGLVNLKSPFKGRTILDGEIIAPYAEVTLPSGVKTTSTLQSCVTGDTRVLTSEGYLKIRDLYEGKYTPEYAWTGHKWSTYGVCKKPAKEICRIELVDGWNLYCDDTHKIKNFYSYKLKATGERKVKFNWKQIKDCKFTTKASVSNPICVEGISIELPFKITNSVEMAYWVGRYYGDGSWTKSKNVKGRGGVTWYFGFHEGEARDRLVKFAKENNLGGWSGTGNGTFRVTFNTTRMFDLLEAWGLYPNCGAKNKRLSDQCFRATLSERRAILEGIMDSDGYKKRRIIHLANPELLKDIMLLYNQTGKDVVLWGPHKDGSAQLCDAVGQSYNFYSDSAKENVKTLRKVDYTGIHEEVYSLMIDDESHAYVADGIISHNTVALMHMNSKDSLEFQKQHGSLRFKVFDIIMLDGKSTEDEVYDVRKELTVTASKAIQEANPDCAIDIVPTIEDYESAWDEFEKYVGEGGEGLILKSRKGKYEQGKRTKGQWKLKGRMTFDAFVTGSVPASDDKQFKDYIGGLVFSTYYKGKEIEIASVSNIDFETRKAATAYDKDGNPKLNPSWFHRCAELVGQNLKEGSFRLGSARINEWRDDKKPEDCELQEEMVRYDR